MDSDSKKLIFSFFIRPEIQLLVEIKIRFILFVTWIINMYQPPPFKIYKFAHVNVNTLEMKVKVLMYLVYRCIF